LGSKTRTCCRCRAIFIEPRILGYSCSDRSTRQAERGFKWIFRRATVQRSVIDLRLSRDQILRLYEGSADKVVGRARNGLGGFSCSSRRLAS
jgi:hypothetical protein